MSVVWQEVMPQHLCHCLRVCRCFVIYYSSTALLLYGGLLHQMLQVLKDAPAIFDSSWCATDEIHNQSIINVKGTLSLMNLMKNSNRIVNTTSFQSSWRWWCVRLTQAQSFLDRHACRLRFRNLTYSSAHSNARKTVPVSWICIWLHFSIGYKLYVPQITGTNSRHEDLGGRCL